jgi:pyruvate dehydrogenase E1 component alpha subunit
MSMTKSKAPKPDQNDISEDLLKQMYEAMVLARVLDERCFKLQRQGRIGFYAGTAGEEACMVGTAMAQDSCDWVFSSYRQPSVALIKGMSLQSLFNNLFGNAEDIAKGRQMPIHYSDREHHFLSVSSVIGTQIIQGVGFAMASRIKQDRAVALTYFGDGATSANDFHSGMNFAATYKAPVVFVLVNNQFAISTPVTRQTGVCDLAEKAKAYGMPGVHVDGNDVLAVYTATRDAIERARAGEGPTLLELKTYRRGPHSSSDDPTRYRNTGEVEEWPDPIAQFERRIEGCSFYSEAYKNQVSDLANAHISDAIEQAEKLPAPVWESVIEDVYEAIPPSLQRQADDIFAHEKHLELTNEGEFPL